MTTRNFDSLRSWLVCTIVSLFPFATSAATIAFNDSFGDTSYLSALNPLPPSGVQVRTQGNGDYRQIGVSFTAPSGTQLSGITFELNTSLSEPIAPIALDQAMTISIYEVTNLDDNPFGGMALHSEVGTTPASYNYAEKTEFVHFTFDSLTELNEDTNYAITIQFDTFPDSGNRYMNLYNTGSSTYTAGDVGYGLRFEQDVSEGPAVFDAGNVFNFNLQTVPEPSGLAYMALGGLALLYRLRRHK